MDNKASALLKKIEKMNVGYRVKIKPIKIKDGSYSIRLDYNYRGVRQRVAIGIYILGDSKNKIVDDNNLNLARTVRDKKEKELLEEGHGIKLSSRCEFKDFLKLYQETIMGKPDANYHLSMRYFRDFIKKDTISVNEIDRSTCIKFKDYLLNLNIKPYTAHHYWIAFKYVLNRAVEQGNVKTNPAKGISIKYDQPQMEFLTINEVKKLIDHPYKYPQIKNGYLFSCFTGLRRSDLNQITFDDIKDNYLYFRQKKTGDTVRIKLNKIAIQIVEEQRGLMKGDRIFSIPTGGRLSARLKEWTNGTSINKDISFHSSRHTFATMLLTKGENVYTVMKLMGHRDIATTTKYLHLVDSMKDKAIDSLDEDFSDVYGANGKNED